MPYICIAFIIFWQTHSFYIIQATKIANELLKTAWKFPKNRKKTLTGLVLALPIPILFFVIDKQFKKKL